MKFSDIKRLVGLGNSPADNARGQGTISRFGFVYAKSTPISLELLKNIRDKDENVALAGVSIAEAVAGNGFEIMIEGRDPTTREPLSEQAKEKALDICRQFAYDCDLDTFNLETIAEYATIGVSFTEKIFLPSANSATGRKDLVKIARLPIDDNWQVETPKTTGGPDFIKAIQNGNEAKPFTPDNLMIWRTNRTSASEWYGRGICWYMAQEKEYTLEFSDGTTKNYRVPPLYVINWALQDDLRLAAHHMTPKAIVNTPGMPDSWVTANAKTINDANAGEALLLNAKNGFDVKTIQADPRFRIDALLNYYDQVLMRAVQTPSPAMYSKEGYSGIFGEQIMQQFGRKIIAMKRYHARRIETELLAQVLAQNGIDPRIVRPRIYWRPDLKMISQLQDYVALFTNENTFGDFTPEERRDIYRKFGAPISGTPPATAKSAIAPASTPVNPGDNTNE